MQFTEKEYYRKDWVITNQPCIYFNKANIAGFGKEDKEYVKSSMLPQRIYARVYTVLANSVRFVLKTFN